jgi:UDP-N-acetylmuramate--alanine ligase
MDEFAKALSLADNVILTDIYAARETDNLGISSEILRDKIAALGTKAYYFKTFEEVQEFVKKSCIINDLLITMGAGNVVEIGENLLK